MKVGIMQPYFVPYIGYWQLLNAVNKFVLYDDVNFIKGGWINRNRILVDGKIKYFNIPMQGASPNKLINEIIVNDSQQLIQKNLRIIEGAYKKAPYYCEIQPLIERILNCQKMNIAEYIADSIKIIGGYLGITTEIIMSSSLDKNCNLKGQDKVLAICNILEATEYYNAIGGQKLYSFSAFNEQGIHLKFLATEPVVYNQFSSEFNNNLSIIDIMMYNSKQDIQRMLKSFSLITEGEPL